MGRPHKWVFQLSFYSGDTSGQDTVLRVDATLELHVKEWMTTDCETHLVLWNANFYPDVISILARLCPAVKHISFDLPCTHLDPVTDDHHMPMRSVITVCFKSMHCFVTLQGFSILFPNAKSLDMIMDKNKYSPLRNLSSLSLRELKLRYTEMYSYNETTDSLFMDISTSCPNILSLVLSGIGFPSDNSGKDITSLKLPHLTNIHLEPIGKLECCRFTTFTKLSEMYPNVKVTVEHHSQASHEYSKYGTGMPFKPERKTSPSSPPFPTSSTGEFI